MVIVSYEIGCRECGATDHMRRAEMINDGVVEDYLYRTEYEIVCVIEEWRRSKSDNCPFCKSNNVQITDVEINDKPLYDFDALKTKHLSHRDYYIYMLNIQKDSENVDANIGGSPIYDDDFLKSSLEAIKQLVDRTHESNFRPWAKGWFFICVTGELNPFNQKYEMEIQRFKVFGVSKSEVYTLLKKVAFDSGIDLTI
jgi:hypothetical protein